MQGMADGESWILEGFGWGLWTLSFIFLPTNQQSERTHVAKMGCSKIHIKSQGLEALLILAA